MKKIISMFLAVLMVVTTVPWTGMVAEAAYGYGHKPINDEICDTLLYAYRAAQFSSPKYYIAQHNINYVYNVESLERSFNSNPTTAIYNSLKNSSNWEKFATVCLTTLTTVFNFDGEITEQDLYDTLLISMLIDTAIGESNELSVVQEVSSMINNVFSSTVTIGNGTSSVVVTMYDYIKNWSNPEDFWSILKSAYVSTPLGSETIIMTIGNDTLHIDGGPLNGFIEWMSKGKASVNTINKIFSEVSFFFSALDYSMLGIDEISEYQEMKAKALIITQSVKKDAVLLLKEMDKETNDLCLGVAIDKYIDLVESGDIDAFCETILMSGSIEFTQKAFAKIFKEKVLMTNPVYAAGALVFTIFDLAGNFSQKAEMIYVIKCINIINTAVLQAMKNIEEMCKTNYDDISCVEMCEGYVTGMLMSFRLESKELDFATEYLQVWYGTDKFNKYFGNDEAWDQWETSIEHIRYTLEVVKPQNFINLALKRYNEHLSVIAKGMTVKYDLNGCSDSIPSQIKPYGKSIQITSVIPERNGYIFLGWEINGQLYMSGESLGAYLKGTGATLEPCWCSNEITLVAQWSEQDSITYYANGKGVTNLPSVQENTGTVTISSKIPKRTGYNFLGWSQDPKAKEPSYIPGRTYEFEEGRSFTLYAVWERIVFNIIFDPNGGEFPSGAETITKTKEYGVSFKFDVEEPKRKGYIFDAWIHTTKTGEIEEYHTGDVESNIGDNTTIDKVMKAKWKDAKVEVKYDFGYGTATNTPRSFTVDTSVSNKHTVLAPAAAAAPEDEFIVNLADFKGWMVQDSKGAYWWATDTFNGGKVSIYNPGDVIDVTQKTVLYAKWDYYVHYNDGTSWSHDIVRDGEGYVIDAPLHTPSGKEFKSWKAEDPNGNITYYKLWDTIDLTSDLTLTATWSDGSSVEKYVTVSYDANEGYGSIASKEVLAGEKVTLDYGDSIGRSGYEFVGWAEEPNAVSRDYKGGEIITVDESITLYAVWKAVNDGTAATVTMAADKEIYEPGDTIIVTVKVDNSDHFYIESLEKVFNLRRQDGSLTGPYGDWTGGTFTEKNAPTKLYPDNRYRNGKAYDVEFYIPDDCEDGVYTIAIRATDSLLNEAGDGNVDGEKAIVAEYSIDIVVEDGYEEKVTVDINKSKLTLHIDDVYTLKAIITPDTNSVTKKLEWYSSNESVVTVEKKSNQKGRLVATGIGKATITAEVNGVTDTCTVVVEKCTYDQKVIRDEYLKTPATCTSYAVYYKSCECGYHGTATFVDEAGGYADHTYDSHWSMDENDHWRICTAENCSAILDKENHIWSELEIEIPPTETDSGIDYRSCTICGYSKTEELPPIGHVHDWSEDYSYDKTHHWHACSGCGGIDGKEEHIFDSENQICVKCGYIIATYKVTYDANRGSRAPAPQIKVEGKALALSSSVPIRNGYKFMGWATYATATEAEYQPGDSYTVDADVTLFAVWEKESQAEIIASGYCGGEGDGTNLIWEFCEDGTLVIYGSGAMKDYSRNDTITAAPWGEYEASLKTLIIEDGVTTIGSNAFYHCTGFTGNLIIPDSVTTIKEKGFASCLGFTGSLVIPDSVTTIGDHAFFHGTGFTGELVIGNNVTTIGEKAFYKCNGLAGSLVIPDSVTIIGKEAFRSCDGFTGDLIIGNGVTTIGEKAFYMCDGFTGDLVIGNSVTTIGSFAFDSCTGFTGNLVMGSSVTIIEDYAFYDCAGLIGNLVIPDSVITIGEHAFEGCTGFTGSLVIGNSVTAIEGSAFNECAGFTGNLVIPDSVTTIEGYAFHKCTSLTGELVLPESVTAIGNKTFYNCGINEYYFEGDAPSVISATENYPSFDVSDDIIYCPSENGTWEIVDGKWNGYRIETWEVEHEALYGDINLDGKINVKDVYLARLVAAKLIKPTEQQLAIGDVDCDGRITAIDANLIRKYAAKIIISLPISSQKEIEMKGSGTKEEPYQVRTPEHLDAVRNDLSAHYIQMNDIDMSDYDSFIPIGGNILNNTSDSFIGKYDGNGFAISNLNINNNVLQYIGLFSYCSEDCELINIEISNADVDITNNSSTYLNIGVIAGYSEGMIYNCTVSGSITVNNYNDVCVGGIAGTGRAEKCINRANISVSSHIDSDYYHNVYCGGIVGHSCTVNSIITKCINYGNIDVTTKNYLDVGGISGIYGIITYCVNYGDISGTVTQTGGWSSFGLHADIGGIFGSNSSDYTSYCVNLGEINTKGYYDGYSGGSLCAAGGIGGCCGYYGSGTINFCYNNANINATEYNENNVSNNSDNIGRIVGAASGYENYNYSTDTSLLNSAIPTDNIGESNKNGGTISQEEFDSKLAEILSIINS